MFDQQGEPFSARLTCTMLVMLALFVVVRLYRTRATCSGIAMIIVANPFVLAGMAPRSSRAASPRAPA
eukprot:COSAG03_NODE_2071_length_3156_cov_2.348708_1_plen_67_part_10